MGDKAEMAKSKNSSQDDKRLKTSKAFPIMKETDDCVERQKMPPDDASRSIPHYSGHDGKHLIGTTHDSESSDQDEPEQKSRLPDDAGQKSMSSSHGDVRKPPLSQKSTTLEENDNGYDKKPLPAPLEDDNLQRLSRSRTPSPVKKSHSFAARSKASEEIRATQIDIAPTDSPTSIRDVSCPKAATDSKPSTSNESSRGRLDDRDHAVPHNPPAARTQDPAHIAARHSYVEKARTRVSLPEVPHTEPKPSGFQKVVKGVSQAFYGPPAPHPEPRQQHVTARELNDLRTAVSDKEFQLRDLEAKLKDQKHKVKELQYSLAMAEEARDDLIRKQQEENFKQMDTGRWLPQEESKIKGDLDRLKRSMKSWSKDCSISSMTPVQNLMQGTEEEIALTQCLSNVVRLDDGRLPPGLNTSKTPSLLLNALLAHDVYQSVFDNPFFFLHDQLDYEPPRLAPYEEFNKLYQMMQANGREAHIWRSQTLRLLYPPLRNSSTDAEINLHSLTDSQIARVSEWHAERFIDGPAHHLIQSDSEDQFIQRVKAIYKTAAVLSYQLWARRTTIKCITLRDMEPHAPFALDNPWMEPHTLVRYDDHPDQLCGRPFTVVVHPIVEAFGTDEGEGYDQKGRVWAKAVVWLDSRMDTRRP